MLDDHPVKAKAAHFNKWTVITTVDKNYPQIIGDIQAYEVFEKQELTSNGNKKAVPRPVKTSSRVKNSKTINAITTEMKDQLVLGSSLASNTASIRGCGLLYCQYIHS